MQLAPEKPRTTSDNDLLHPIIAERWSPRAFSQSDVDPAIVRSVLEAARWAPSAANRQPWNFIVASARDSDAHQKLLSVLYDMNVRWAQHAPVLMLVVATQYTDRDGNLTSRSLYDAGLAVGALTFQAGHHGLVVHQMGGFDAAKAGEVFNIPAGHEAIAALALGYAGDPDSLPDDLRERELAPRTRKQLAEFVYEGSWGRPAAFSAAE
jgi:nitroreductase